MQDQVLGLRARALRACFLGSAQTDATLWDRLRTMQFVLGGIRTATPMAGAAARRVS